MLASADEIPFVKGLHEIGEGVYAYLQPDGGWGRTNSGLVVSGGHSLLIDTLMDYPHTTEMLAAMREQVPAAGQISTLVNTHADGDHFFGNELVGAAEIVASSTTAEEMSIGLPPSTLSELVNAAPEMGVLGEYALAVFGDFQFDGITLILPTRTFDNRLTLDVEGRPVELFKLGPAHSGGDVVVVVPDASVVFAGDLLFNGVHPLIPVGPIDNWITACDEIIALEPRIVVPGHGAVGDATTVAEFREYLQWLTEQAGQRHAAGMSPLEASSDILASNNPYGSWLAPERIVTGVSTVYRALGDDLPSDPSTLFGIMATLWKQNQNNGL